MTADEATGTLGPPLIRVFGGIRVEGEDGPVNIGGHRQRRLLALLALRSDSIVGLDFLAEHLWEDHERPEATAPALRTYLSRLRTALPEAAQGWIETEAAGYRFVAPAESVEHRRFAMLRAEATRARKLDDPLAAHDRLDEALAMWRGDPFRELEDMDWARGDIERLKQDRLEMLEERWEVALTLGRHTQITGELAAFTAEHDLRDRAIAQYALALHRSGRTPEALRVIAAHRRRLADQTGLDLAPEVVELERLLLAADPSLNVEKLGRPLRGYRLLEQTGIGAFSIVWRGMQPSVGREVAIKQIRSELACQPEFIRRFEAEAHLVARLEHPHIVPLIDYWRDPDSAYLVMRWMRGGTLERLLDDGPLTIAQTLALSRQIGGALSAAHAHGIVHRDVKTANILLDDEGNAFLGDFGIALKSSESAGPEAALSPGSAAYSSPEQIRRERLGPEADVFSLGVVIFECLAGSLPFPRASSVDELVQRQLHDPYPLLSELRSDVPDSVVTAVAKATAKDPADRFGSMAELISALEPTEEPPHAGQDVHEGDRAFTRLDVVNPYKGLRAFDDGDIDQFFGRESLVSQLVERLGENTVRSRCLVVVGPSGSGKSSVVRAGLGPALRAGAVPGSADWFTTTMVPGSDPFESLEAALLRVSVNPPLSLLERLRDGERGILRSVRRCLGSGEDRVLLVIDQFEEVFIGHSSQDAHAFLAALAVAVEDPASPLRLVLTLRADYYHCPLEHPSFARILNETAVNVTPLAPNELESAIVEPARRVGVEFEPGLVARIAAETTGQPSPLPLLQYTLSELFDRRTGAQMTIEAYDQLGGLTGALAVRAERLYFEADDAQRSSIRRIFGHMTNPGEESVDLRRRVPLGDLGDDPSVAWVLERLGAARLVTFDRDIASREPTVEVAHEALLREWPRLATWLEEDRDLLRIAHAVATAVTDWDVGGRAETDLYRGGRLENAVDLALTAPDRLRPLDTEFIEASRTAAEAERLSEQRRLRRLRSLVVGVGAALVVALIAGALALRQSNRADGEAQRAQESAAEAEAQARLAETQTEAALSAAEEAELATIVSRSAAQAGEDPELALLLALEAHRRAPGAASEQAVLNALGSTTLSNRVSSLGPLSDAAGPCPDTVLSTDGFGEFGVANGHLVSRDPAIGTVTEHGLPPAPCVLWMASQSANRRVAVAEDGRRMWLGPFEGPWEVEREFDRPTFLVSRSFQSTQRLVFVSDRDGRPAVTLLDDTTGELVGDPLRVGEGFVDLAASADGSRLAMAFGFSVRPEEGTGLIVVVDGETGEEQLRVNTEFLPRSVTIDDAANQLIVGVSDNRTITTVDLATGETVAQVETTTSASLVPGGLGIRSDGLIVAVSGSQIELIDRFAGPTRDATDLRDVIEARVRPDGTVLTYTADHRPTVVDLDSNALIERAWPVERFAEIEIHDGRATVVSEPAGAPELIDLATGDRATFDLITPEGESPPAIGAIPFGDAMWVVHPTERLTLWEDGQFIQELFLGGPPFTGKRLFDRLAVVLASAPGFERVQLVDLVPGGSGVLLTVPASNAIATVPSADGGIHVRSHDGTLETFDASGALTGSIETTALDGRLITADPATGKLAMPGKGGTVLIVDTSTGQIKTLPVVDSIIALGFARHGELLVIVAQDGTVRLWDLEQNTSAGLVWDGSGAASAGVPWYDEATETVWVATSGQLLQIPVSPQRWVDKACEIVGRGLTQDEWDRFVPGDESRQSSCT